MRSQVALGQRLALARALNVPWHEIANAERMSERTLRHFLARWHADLGREREPVSELLSICAMSVRELAADLERRKRQAVAGA